MLLQGRFSKFINMITETLDISLIKLSPDPLFLQVHVFHYDLEVDQTFPNWFKMCRYLPKRSL